MKFLCEHEKRIQDFKKLKCGQDPLTGQAKNDLSGTLQKDHRKTSEKLLFIY